MSEIAVSVEPLIRRLERKMTRLAKANTARFPRETISHFLEREKAKKLGGHAVCSAGEGATVARSPLSVEMSEEQEAELPSVARASEKPTQGTWIRRYDEPKHAQLAECGLVIFTRKTEKFLIHHVHPGRVEMCVRPLVGDTLGEAVAVPISPLWYTDGHSLTASQSQALKCDSPIKCPL